MARVGGGGRTWRWLARHRLAVQVAIDSVAWIVALSFAVLARYDFNPERINPRGLALMAPLVVLAASRPLCSECPSNIRVRSRRRAPCVTAR